MPSESTVDIAAAFELGIPIDEAMQEAFQEAVRQHLQAGLPLVVWRDGEIAHVPAVEFLKSATLNRDATLAEASPDRGPPPEV